MNRSIADTVLAVLAVLLATATATPARADSFWTSTSGGTIEVPQITITAITGDQLEFRSLSGTPSHRPLASITRVQVSNEPALNAAEDALAAGRWDEATDGYLRAARTSVTPWVKQWAGLRLMAVAQKTGRFDAAVVGYVEAVRADPSTARKPAPLPEPQSRYIDGAVRDLQAAAGEQGLSAEQKRALLSLLMDLHRVRDDQDAAAGTIQQMLDLGELDASDPEAAAQLARLRLDLAAVAIDRREYQKAIDEITASRALFTDSHDQADALYALAEARYGLARSGGTTDEAALKDAALAYMRVVAHFKDLPGQPHVADALLRTARIHEDLGDPAAALALYQQVAAEHADQPAATEARTATTRLQRDTATQPRLQP